MDPIRLGRNFMTELVFVDTNVLVYARDSRDPVKQAQAETWVRFLWESRRGRLSSQVLHEYYETVTRKLNPGMERIAAREDIRALRCWEERADAGLVLEQAWVVQDRFGFSFWDSLIMGAAITYGCSYLLTEDLKEGLEFDGLTVVNPFSFTPDKLLSLA